MGNVEVNWLDPEISVTRMMQAYASDADLIVLGFPQPHDSDQKRRAVHAAIFDSGRPVMFVPPGWNRSIGRNILLAWKDTPSCRRTVRSVRPILATAHDVAVMRADTDTSSVLADLLAGLAVRYLPPEDDGAPEDVTRVILRQCHDTGRDLLVMGDIRMARSITVLWAASRRIFWNAGKYRSSCNIEGTTRHIITGKEDGIGSGQITRNPVDCGRGRLGHGRAVLGWHMDGAVEPEPAMGHDRD